MEVQKWQTSPMRSPVRSTVRSPVRSPVRSTARSTVGFCVPDDRQCIRNLAKYGKVTQSSIYTTSKVDPRAELAIDGNDDNNFHKASCTHTQREKNPWWMLDIGESQSIGEITLVNRRDCCSQRLEGAEIRVGDSPNHDNPICGIVSDVSKDKNVFCCHGMSGRYVSVTIPRTEYLSLCEVEVYPYHKPASASSEEDPITKYD
ncbi:fucolectin-like [Pelodytes ibericus]